MGHGLYRTEISIIDALIRKTIEKASQILLIRRLNGSEVNLHTAFEGLLGGNIGWTESDAFGREHLIRIDDLRLFGLFHECLPVVRMGNVDQRQ